MESDPLSFCVLLPYNSLSIHALRMESDIWISLLMIHCMVFLSTLSAWRATRAPAQLGSGRALSIHALRMESDYNARKALQAEELSIHALRMESDNRRGG